jgi:predicted 3-demethylubiquinone-9 3-methyltransferase (glyoxalase superfamily)
MSDKITPCLWFDFNAEEVVAVHLRTFGNGRILLAKTRQRSIACGPHSPPTAAAKRPAAG